MIVLDGIPTSPGYAMGCAVVYDFEAGCQLAAPRRTLLSAEVEAEWNRLDEAINASGRDLQGATDGIPTVASPPDVLALLASHAAMTAEIANLVKRQVDLQLVNVEQALDLVIGDWLERLHRIDSVYLRQREQDVRDVGRRLKRYLAGSLPWRQGPMPTGAIVVTRELMPSEIIEFAHCDVAAVISERGGRYGHTAILARSFGLPAVTRVLHATSRIQPGAALLVDGETGQVVVDPTPSDRQLFAQKRSSYLRELATSETMVEAPCVTADGVQIELHANIGRPQELAAVIRQQLSGVGLFRTEFLLMEANERPELESQALVYTQIANELGGKPLVIRTFDLGRGKLPPFLLREDLPDICTLNLNGLQFSLVERNLFQLQIAAILQVAQTADIRILLPMVIGSDDFSQAVTQIEHIAERYNLIRTPPIGAMIETPAAIFGLEEILDRADFLAIGTNDLTQFMLGTDRDVVDDYAALHPAVLRAIYQVCETAARRQCPVCVCGEAAGDVDFACLMVGMGIEELSLAPDRVPAIRRALRAIDTCEAKELATVARSCGSSAEVRSLIGRWPASPPKVTTSGHADP